jgi:beta-glucosidase/6-phospho-beta-glucosidase/beta-galactosidase
LPPFVCSISQREYLNNINQAQVLACKKMKEINPNLKVLISHQWKPMKPYHSMLSPWYGLETLVCYVADRMYNGDFVRILTPHQNDFDGIALSVYPAFYFNGWKLENGIEANHSGKISEQDALDTIMQTHQAFPNKDIYIIEAGCNTKDPERKKEFIDMMLRVCKITRDRGVKIKGLYFWGHTNDPEFYSEWNLQPGSTNFAPFETLNPEYPCNSINAAGLYLQEIVKP